MSRDITPAQRRAVGRYEAANYDKVLVRLPKGEREQIKAAADSAGESMNAYILDAVRQRMEHDRTRKPGEAQKPKI